MIGSPGIDLLVQAGQDPTMTSDLKDVATLSRFGIVSGYTPLSLHHLSTINTKREPC